MVIDWGNATEGLRDDLGNTVESVWRTLGSAGTWWSGADRLAIVAEIRHARSCQHCAECKESLSPFGVEGTHDVLANTPATVIDLIHRVVNDPARLTSRWFEETLGRDVLETEYVETVGIIACVTAIDYFRTGLGLELLPLPDVQPGEPSRVEPEDAARKIAWVRTVSPRSATGELERFWFPTGERGYVPRIFQAASLVPQAMIEFGLLSEAMYLPRDRVASLEGGRGNLSRDQIELIAARSSALNECFY